MENLISIFVDSVFVGNILLAYFLGMCSFLAVSKNLQTSLGLGIAVVFVLTITTPVNWLIYRYLLAPGALAWAGLPDVDLSFLKLILFIAIIAALLTIVGYSLNDTVVVFDRIRVHRNAARPVAAQLEVAHDFVGEDEVVDGDGLAVGPGPAVTDGRLGVPRTTLLERLFRRSGRNVRGVGDVRVRQRPQ